MKTALVSGAGIAGLTTAYWLHRDGYQVTVIERASSFRLGGQPVDVRGPAGDVVGWMGILDKVRAVGTRIRGMSVMDADGNEIKQTTDWTLSTGPLDGPDVEILRDDLARFIRELANDGIEYIYGNTIIALEDEANGVSVAFESGPSRRFDLLVGADGLHSRVRKLALGSDQNVYKHLGTYLSVYTSDNFLDLDNWQLWHQGEDNSYIVFPVHDNKKLRITLSFSSPPKDFDLLPIAEQKKLVAEHLSPLGGEVPRMLDAMWKSDDFYFVAMAQVKLEHFSKGRVVLVGDAGYCASPLSGQGTSLALVGAYVLAEELRNAGDDYRSAFVRYEERMRPYVELNQDIATADPGAEGFLKVFERARTGISLEG